MGTSQYDKWEYKERRERAIPWIWAQMESFFERRGIMSFGSTCQLDGENTE
jgi:hypothetical protein